MSGADGDGCKRVAKTWVDGLHSAACMWMKKKRLEKRIEDFENEDEGHEEVCSDHDEPL